MIDWTAGATAAADCAPAFAQETGASFAGAPELTPAQFHRICRLAYESCGINLQEGKEELVRSRLARRLARLGMEDFDRYVDFVEKEASAQELRAMIDALTTNKTSFFRETPHFDFLRESALPCLRRLGRKMRFWSAGCSTGEEPYSLAITLLRELTPAEAADCRILATDISERVLAEARAAAYPVERMEDVPSPVRGRFFQKVPGRDRTTYQMRPEVRALVRFARLNLMDDWPMTGPFDLILCRNVMIYFDTATRKNLVSRFVALLRPGGYLFVGHSESLPHSPSEYQYVQPAIYVKNGG